MSQREVLLVTSDGKGRYWSPGGHQKPNESHIDTLRRELSEELSLELTGAKHVISLDEVGSRESGSSHYYLCRASGIPKPQGEITDYRWFTYEKLDKDYRQSNGRLMKALDLLRKTNLV